MSFNNGWKEYKISSLYDSYNGLSKNRKEFGFGYPFLSFKEVFDNYFVPNELKNKANTSKKERKKFSISKGDVFITRTSEKADELGMACVALKDYPEATFNGFTKRLRPSEKENIDPKFISFYLNSPQFRNQVKQMSIITTRASLNNEMLDKIKIKLPPINEQKKIGILLYSLNKKIENNNKMNKTLEKTAQAIYKSWFVDFEPFQDRKFVESELGMIPEGWEVGNLGDKNLTKLVRGSINEFVGEKIYLATADVNDKKIEDYNTIITYDEKPSRANRKPEPNTIWFAKMRNSKKLILVSEYNKFLINNIILSTGFMGLDVQEYALYYIWNFINNEDFEEKKDKLCTGTTMEAINMTNTKKIKILIPSKEILDKFNSLMEPIYKKINNNKVETRNLKELRDSLLPKLMSGEIRVPLEKDEREVN